MRTRTEWGVGRRAWCPPLEVLARYWWEPLKKTEAAECIWYKRYSSDCVIVHTDPSPPHSVPALILPMCRGFSSRPRSLDFPPRNQIPGCVSGLVVLSLRYHRRYLTRSQEVGT